jgi:hypothetical protein
VATWGEFAEQEPEMASLGQRIISRYGIAYLGTVRPDGGPRVHPVTPVIFDGHAYIGLIPDTPKRRDLDRDPRYALHTLPGPNDAEVHLTGIVRQLPMRQVDELLELAPPNVRIARDTPLYELQVQRVTCTVFDQVGTGERPVPRRTRWVARRDDA